MKIATVIAIILGVVAIVLLGVLVFVKPAKAPTPVSGTSADGHLQVDAFAAPVASPLIITGSVTGGGWFFEGSFPIKIVDGNGTVLGTALAQAQSDWMSTGTVPFRAAITFSAPHSATGTVIFNNDNPSGLPQNAKSMSIQVTFNSVTTATSTAPTGMVQGSVSLSPTCPVERIPPDPACGPKPYQTTIAISRNLENPTAFKTVQSDASGNFTVSLAPGEYDFYVQSTAVYPRCPEVVATVRADVITPVQISCDTGIR